MLRERELIKLSIFGVFRFSVLLSLFFSFVASQIELIDAVERGRKDLLTIFFASFPAYFSDVFLLSLPISAFRFFSARRKIFIFLNVFGFSKLRFVLTELFIFLLVLSLLSPLLFHISSRARDFLFDVKEERKKTSFFVKDEHIFFIKSVDGGVEVFEITRDGKVLSQYIIKEGTPEYTAFKSYIAHRFYSFQLGHYLIFSFASALNTSFSSFIALSYVEYGFLLTLALLSITLIFLLSIFSL